MDKNFDEAYKFYINQTGENITKEEFAHAIETLKNKEPIQNAQEKSESELGSVAGGKNELKRASALMSALAIMSPYCTDYKELSQIGTSGERFQIVSSVRAEGVDTANETSDLKNYILEAKISKVEEEIAEIIKKYVGTNKYLHVSSMNEISSARKFGAKNKTLTEVEKKIDKAVKDGDLPARSFTAKEICNLKRQLDRGRKVLSVNRSRRRYACNPKYTVMEYDCGAINLQDEASDEAIVQIASSFAALESMSPSFSPVKYWFADKTQGPMACLQSVAACKHRESAALFGKLPDAIRNIVEGFQVEMKSGPFKLFKKKVKITEKYKNLYKWGYLDLNKIGEDNLEDLRSFADYLIKNKENLGITTHWVRCEKTGKKQLQVFCAAPSFQYGGYIDWDDETDPRMPIFKEVCENLVEQQYRAIAQIAAIRSTLTRKQEELHIYQVGQGAFYNPKSVMLHALRALQEELEGYDVRVFLHDGYRSRCSRWGAITAEVQRQELEKLKNESQAEVGSSKLENLKSELPTKNN